MTGAFLAGLLASSALLVGALVSIRFTIGRSLLGLILGFGSGVLISAVAYDLVGDAITISDGRTITAGLVTGALVFYAGDMVIDGAGGAGRKRPQANEASAPMAIVLGTVLDGVPESVVLGLTLLDGEGVSLTMFVAIFISNLPEAVGATTGLLAGGRPRSRVLAMWALVVLVSGLASLVGYAALDGAAAGSIAFVQAFAAGAILTMLADTMMPEAFEGGGPATGLATTVGFALAFTLVTLEG
jgi:ZIP family zinc transporter